MSGVPLPAYPVNLDLRGAPCLVIGGGPVAARKVAGLLECGAAVTVVAPVAEAAIAGDERIRWHQRPYQRGEVASYRVAIAATGDVSVDEQVSRDARAAGIPVNVADDPERCTFTLPAVHRDGAVQITVSTNGESPALSAWLRTELASALPANLGTLVELLADARAELQRKGQGTEVKGWNAAFADGLAELVAAGRTDQARALLRGRLGLDAPPGIDVAPGEPEEPAEEVAV